MNPAEGAESATSAVEPATVSDTESFEVFFRARHGDLFTALWPVTRDRQGAEEIMQDAFLRVWERWDRVAALEDHRPHPRLVEVPPASGGRAD